MPRILSREGTASRVSGFFFKAVIQMVLIFVADTWVVTPHMGKALGGSQTQVEGRLTGQLLWRTTDGKWRYTSAAAAREEAWILTMEDCVSRPHNTFTQYVATILLLDLCEGSERALGERVGMWWWEQDRIDLKGER